MLTARKRGAPHPKSPLAAGTADQRTQQPPRLPAWRQWGEGAGGTRGQHFPSCTPFSRRSPQKNVEEPIAYVISSHHPRSSSSTSATSPFGQLLICQGIPGCNHFGIWTKTNKLGIGEFPKLVQLLFWGDAKLLQKTKPSGFSWLSNNSSDSSF